MKQKASFIIFNGLLMKQIMQFFSERLETNFKSLEGIPLDLKKEYL